MSEWISPNNTPVWQFYTYNLSILYLAVNMENVMCIAIISFDNIKIN